MIDERFPRSTTKALFSSTKANFSDSLVLEPLGLYVRSNVSADGAKTFSAVENRSQISRMSDVVSNSPPSPTCFCTRQLALSAVNVAVDSVKLVVKGEFETASLAHSTDLRSIFNGTEAFSQASAHIDR